MAGADQPVASGASPLSLVRLSLIAVSLWLASLGLSFMPSQADSPLAFYLQQAFMLLFVVFHAAAWNGWRGAAAFVAIVFAVGLGSEICNQLTGFPFGWVTHNLPARLMGVPLATALSYVTNAWPAWVMTRILLAPEGDSAGRPGLVAAPIVAALIVTGVDLPYDPIASIVLKLYVYRHPSGLFGVPITNFVGWLLTSWVFFQLFALMESRLPIKRAPRSRVYWLLPSAIWIVWVLGYIPWYAAGTPGVVSSGDRSYFAADVFEAGLIMAVVTMLPRPLPRPFACYRKVTGSH